MSGETTEYGTQEMDLKQTMQNMAIVEALYRALANGHGEATPELLASDLDWWFHGPPLCQHMMRVLTGKSSHAEFRFRPQSIEAIGDCVTAEGWECATVYWVHVWTLKDGMITKFREYFNTQLTVKDMRPNGGKIDYEIPTLWQSHPRDNFKRSLPGILLAI